MKLVIVVRMTEAMRAPAIFMVDQQRMVALDREGVLRILVVTVA
jgi:hypothetical protein